MQEGAKQHGWNGGDDQPQGETRAGGIHPTLGQAGQTEQSGAYITPEKDHNGGQGADVNRHVDDLALVCVAGQFGQENQMTRGGDRQKFGNPLNQRYKNELEQRHRDQS